MDMLDTIGEMSYSSQNVLPQDTRLEEVREFVLLLGYARTGVLKSESERYEEYWWFDATDYRSWSGVELSIRRNESGRVCVLTRSVVARSYYDLIHQNNTISILRKRFGGEFETDEGRRRYLRPSAGPPEAPASGCHLAFERFGGNLIKAMVCHEARHFPNQPSRSRKGLPSGLAKLLDEIDPRTLANNTLVPFLVAVLEDYFKSTFVALLRYSARKEAFLKNVRLQGDQLVAVSDCKATVEEQVAETLPFQRLPAICRHFTVLDPKLDIAGALRKPYRRRTQSLFDSIDSLVLSRHEFIHRAILDLTMTDERIDNLIHDLEAAITRVYRRITEHHDWVFDKGWNVGRSSRRRVQSSKQD
jgi:hypothetical protein